jgi:hypothetical protein
MKRGLFYSALILLLSFTLYGDEANGKILYHEAKCAKCHSDDIFLDEDRKIKNLKKLKKRVAWCGHQHNASWFDDEVLDVVEYLNKHFYKFPTKE